MICIWFVIPSPLWYCHSTYGVDRWCPEWQSVSTYSTHLVQFLVVLIHELKTRLNPISAERFQKRSTHRKGWVFLPIPHIFYCHSDILVEPTDLFRKICKITLFLVDDEPYQKVLQSSAWPLLHKRILIHPTPQRLCIRQVVHTVLSFHTLSIASVLQKPMLPTFTMASVFFSSL